MRFQSALVMLSIARISASALSFARSSAPPGDALVQTVYQFPNNTWAENLAPRANGKVLVTLITKPEVWEIDPATHTAELVYEFPNALSACGIVEYAPNMFAVNVGNWSTTTFAGAVGSWGVWNLDLQAWDKCDGLRGGVDRRVTVSKIAEVPEAIFLNGLTSLPRTPTTLMAADSGAGKIYSLDVNSGLYHTAIADAALKSNASSPFELGVNGINVRPSEPGYIYPVNSLKRPRLVRIPIDPINGGQTRPVEVIVDDVPFETNLYGAADDFALDNSGYAWITSDPTNILWRASLSTGDIKVIAGSTNSPVVAGLTSCRFGSGEADVRAGRLYIVTNGGMADPAAAGVVGGRLISLDTSEL